MRLRGWAGWIAALALSLLSAPSAHAADEAVEEEDLGDLDEGVELVPLRRLDVVQNKSFTKEGRVELYPTAFGLITNNHFARRQVIFTGLGIGFHVREQVYLDLTTTFFPYTEANIKALTKALLSLNASSDRTVTVPAEKLYLGLSIGYSPVYGKINLVGEHVQNFDVSFLTGLGLLQVENHEYAFGGYTPDYTDIVPAEVVGSPTKENFLTGHLGIASRFPVVDWLTLKADARLIGYVQQVPDYLGQPTVNEQGETEYPEKNAFNTTFVVSVGAAFFFPRMHPGGRGGDTPSPSTDSAGTGSATGATP